ESAAERIRRSAQRHEAGAGVPHLARIREHRQIDIVRERVMSVGTYQLQLMSIGNSGARFGAQERARVAFDQNPLTCRIEARKTRGVRHLCGGQASSASGRSE